MGVAAAPADVPAPGEPPVHALPAPEVARALATDEHRGLSSQEAAERLRRYGPNRPQRRERPAYISLALRQLASPLVVLLAAAAAVSAAIGDAIEAAAIGAILVLNAVLGFVQEAAAERAVLELRENVAQTAAIIREGLERELPAADVVIGDLVVLREGERVPADGRLVRAQGLEVDESPLTGESLPVGKSTGCVAAEAPLADRESMVYGGTSVTRGRGASLVTGTGDETELGLIARLAATAKPPATPLQRRLGRLARTTVAAGGLITLALTGAMLLRGSSLHEAFLIGVAVAVAAVPEGLPATVTIALALGAHAMARAGAIVRRLSAIEAIGEATVICTDKTGTLTENRLRLASALPAAGVDERELLAAAVLASSAEVVEDDHGPRVVGAPVERALVLAAMDRGLSRSDLLAERRHMYEVPFEAERKRMTVVYEEPSGRRAYAKGAPELLLEQAILDAAERTRLAAAAQAWAEEGLRVLAVGERAVDELRETDDFDRPLHLLGLVALHDPLRASAPAAIEEARAAGVQVRMLTGDHPETARTIGHALGLPESAVFARVTPAEKLRLIEELQARGEVVAVTGDGVNDAPALRCADVGVAMGRSGTEVAREAADIVLTDDDFGTIVAALREGRRIADNIRKFVAFLLSANLGEVVLFAVAVVAGLGAPMTVVQVLLVNVLTDGLPALALARDPALPETMAAGPRRSGSLLGRRLTGALAIGGVAVGLVALGAYLVGRSVDRGTAQTMAFATVALAELALVFSCRSVQTPAWRVAWNPHLMGGVLLSALTTGLVLYLPALHGPFGTVTLSALELATVVGFAAVPFALLELAKAIARVDRARAPRLR